jgi:hypothetical protein
MLTFTRRTKIIAAFIVLLGVGYGLVLFWQSQNGVPANFTAARIQGAIIAQTIVNNSNQSTNELSAINKYDQEGNYTAALASTTALINQSAGFRNEALQLATLVQQMSTEIPNIKSTDAQRAAVQSMTDRLAVINELITYSNDLDHLLAVLRSRFSGTPQPNGEVANIVSQINADVNMINNFNSQAGQAMDTFDSIEK